MELTNMQGRLLLTLSQVNLHPGGVVGHYSIQREYRALVDAALVEIRTFQGASRYYITDKGLARAKAMLREPSVPTKFTVGIDVSNLPPGFKIPKLSKSYASGGLVSAEPVTSAPSPDASPTENGLPEPDPERDGPKVGEMWDVGVDVWNLDQFTSVVAEVLAISDQQVTLRVEGDSNPRVVLELPRHCVEFNRLYVSARLAAIRKAVADHDLIVRKHQPSNVDWLAERIEAGLVKAGLL